MRRFLLSASAALVLACASPAKRIEKAPEKFSSYPADVQQKIKNGEIDIGFDQDAVWMALGKADREYTRTTANGSYHIWGYGRGARSGPGVGLTLGAASGGVPGAGGVYGAGSVSVGNETWYQDELRVVFQGGRVVALEKGLKP